MKLLFDIFYLLLTVIKFFFTERFSQKKDLGLIKELKIFLLVLTVHVASYWKQQSN